MTGMQNCDKTYSESGLMTVINRTGSALLLGICFLIGCIPIITAGTSLSSFYYAMTKTVRHERSYPLKEFCKAFGRNLAKGIAYTVLVLLAALLLFVNRQYSAVVFEAKQAVAAVAVYDVLIGFLMVFALWIFPVISRFDTDVKKTLRLTFTAAIRSFGYTLLLAAITAVSVLLILKLSAGFVLIIPAAACYAATYVIEPVFKKYIPKPEHGEDGWYYAE